MVFGCLLPVTIDERAGILILSLCHAINLTPLLLSEQDESRVRHGVPHGIPVQLVRVQVDDAVSVFDLYLLLAYEYRRLIMQLPPLIEFEKITYISGWVTSSNWSRVCLSMGSEESCGTLT